MGIFDASNQQSTSYGGVAPYAMPYAMDYLQRAQQVANTPYTQSPSQYVGPNAYMQDAWKGVTQTAQGGATQNPYASMQNPELQRQIRGAQGDLAKSWNDVQMPAWSKAMANSGSFGNSGVMQATGNAMGDLSRAMGDIGSNMRFNAYNQAANLSENFANRNDAFKQWGAGAQMNIGNQMQGFNQAQANQNYNWWQQAQQYPQQQLNVLGNALGVAGGNSQTVNQPGPSQAGQFLGGALAGAQIGNLMNWW